MEVGSTEVILGGFGTSRWTSSRFLGGSEVILGSFEKRCGSSKRRLLGRSEVPTFETRRF